MRIEKLVPYMMASKQSVTCTTPRPRAMYVCLKLCDSAGVANLPQDRHALRCAASVADSVCDSTLPI